MRRYLEMLLVLLCVGAGGVSLSKAQETEYFTGAVLSSPEYLAGLPSTPSFRAFLPERFDLSMSFPVIGNQKRQGSCTAWAVGYAARAYYSESHEGRKVSDTRNIPSPAYIFNSISHAEKCSGSAIPEALDLLKIGAPSLRDFPYTDKSCDPPSSAIVASASDFRITSWSRVNFGTSLDQVKGALINGDPVIIGFVSNEPLKKMRGKEIWRAGTPSPDEVKNHAVTVVGYDDRREAFKFINSWGDGWGDRGFGYISYDTFSKRVNEAYVMSVPARAAPVVPPRPLPRPEPDPAPPGPEPVITPVDLDLPSDLVCASVRKSDDGQGIVGFVSTEADLARIEAIATEKTLQNKVQVRPWPQCEVLLTLAEPLGSPEAPVLTIPNTEYLEGDQLVINLETPNFDGYVYVAYIQADGSVATLEQVTATSFTTRAPHSKLIFGDGKDGRASFTVGKPFGNEMVVALASKSPLFAEPRPGVETEREFLTALRLAVLKKAQSGAPDRLVTAAAVGLVTVPSKTVPVKKEEPKKCKERAVAC